jgi:hypothetical protein
MNGHMDAYIEDLADEMLGALKSEVDLQQRAIADLLVHQKQTRPPFQTSSFGVKSEPEVDRDASQVSDQAHRLKLSEANLEALNSGLTVAFRDHLAKTKDLLGTHIGELIAKAGDNLDLESLKTLARNGELNGDSE